MAFSDFTRLYQQARRRDHAIILQVGTLLDYYLNGPLSPDGPVVPDVIALTRTAEQLIKSSRQFRDDFALVANPIFQSYFPGQDWPEESCPVCGSPDCLGSALDGLQIIESDTEDHFS